MGYVFHDVEDYPTTGQQGHSFCGQSEPLHGPFRAFCLAPKIWPHERKSKYAEHALKKIDPVARITFVELQQDGEPQKAHNCGKDQSRKRVLPRPLDPAKCNDPESEAHDEGNRNGPPLHSEVPIE